MGVGVEAVSRGEGAEGEWELESEESWDRRGAGVGVGIREDIVMENYGEIRRLFIHVARLCLPDLQYGRASANVIAQITVVVTQRVGNI